MSLIAFPECRRRHVSTINRDRACYTFVTALQRVIDTTIDKMACTMQSMCATMHHAEIICEQNASKIVKKISQQMAD